MACSNLEKLNAFYPDFPVRTYAIVAAYQPAIQLYISYHSLLGQYLGTNIIRFDTEQEAEEAIIMAKLSE